LDVSSPRSVEEYMRIAPFLLFSLFTIGSGVAHAALGPITINPEGGSSGGGTQMVITGSGFFGGCATPCSEVQVTFDGISATSVSVNSDTRIAVITPPRNGLAVYFDQFATPPTSVVVKVGSETVRGPWFMYNDTAPVPDLSWFARVLLPSYNCGLRGAQGSEWCAQLSLFNASPDPVVAYPVYPDRDGLRISAVSVPSRHFSNLGLLRVIGKSFDEVAPRSARVMYIDPARADDLRLNLRIYDDSRRQTTWGTEVPVVRERDLRTTAIEIFPVPLDPLFRQALRIYDPFRLGDGEVEVRFYIAGDGKLVATRRATLAVFERTMPYDGAVDQSFPGLAELNNLMLDVPELAAVSSTEELRIEVVPLTPRLRFWAMVSLTNNDTQHVTLLTPQ
jgi:IPT/TIG domain